MKTLYLVVAMLIFSVNATAEESPSDRGIQKNNIAQLKDELESLKLELNSLNEQVKQSDKRAEVSLSDLKSNLFRVEENTRKRLARIDKEFEGTNNQIDSVEASVTQITLAWSHSSDIAKLGAIVLLSGLLIEIIGATVLAGTHLVTEQKEVYTLKSTPPCNDLSMTDVNSEPRIDFLGAIASFMLFFGFVLQFTGTIVVLSLPAWLAATMVMLAIIPGTLVIYYLLGQSYNQSRKEKIKVIIENIKRNLTPSFGAKCEVCSKSLKFDESYVFWSKEPDSENHPYLHPPYNMHLGHKGCLESSGKYEQPKGRHQELEGIEMHQKKVAEFLKRDVPAMKKWWSEYRRHWAERGNSEESVSFSEHMFHQLLREIDKLKPKKYLHSDHLSAASSLQDGV
ncbi:hypothetical protein MLD55_05000 [Alcanivorax sp. MM125-6]|nr:hypothetical protein [Alcanivorax sp. MM125-6]